MPVGTVGTVKAMYLDQVRDLGADIILGNTYHLMLRPGAERVARLGGLHQFIRWERPILTDSGGFQVMSLSSLRKLNEQGVTFKSHVDGALYHMSPERSIEIQACSAVTFRCSSTNAWRCRRNPTRSSARWKCRCAGRALQGRLRRSAGKGDVRHRTGGDIPRLRERSALALQGSSPQGYAVGGLPLVSPQEVMLGHARRDLPRPAGDKPRY